MSDLNQANSFFAQGRQYANQNRLKEAEDAFRKAIELHPTYGAAYTWIGHILEKAGRIKDAEAAFQQAIHAEPLIEYHHSNLGTLFMKQERFVEAEASFRKALELTPMEDYLYFNLGVSLLKQNRLAEAEVAFRKVLEISPNDRAASEKLEVVLSQRRSETSEVTVQGATSEEHRKREEEIIRFREDCAGFIRDGYKFINKNRFGPWKGYQWVYFDYGHHDEIDSYDDHIDDAKQRFDWIIAHW